MRGRLTPEQDAIVVACQSGKALALKKSQNKEKNPTGS